MTAWRGIFKWLLGDNAVPTTEAACQQLWRDNLEHLRALVGEASANRVNEIKVNTFADHLVRNKKRKNRTQQGMRRRKKRA
jgi:ribosomal protein L16/L10AE